MRKWLILLPLILCLTSVDAQNRKNEQIVSKYLEIWSNGKTEALGAICAQDMERHVSGQNTLTGLNNLSQLIEKSRDNMRRYKIEPLSFVSNREQVAVHWRASYWVRDDSMVKWEGMSIFKIEDIKIQEETVVANREQLLRQLGYKILPPEE